MAAPPISLPGMELLDGLAMGVGRAIRTEWQSVPTTRWAASRPRPTGFAIRPVDFRPADAEAGRRILAGAFVLAGQTLAVGPRGDPWDRPSPSKRFAEALHGFSWLPDLVDAPDGAAEGLRLYLEWRRIFGKWNEFAWSAPVLERRVFNLACAGHALAARASDAETATLAGDLARQARTLLALGGSGPGAAERACAAAVAGAAMSGKAADRLRSSGLKALIKALPLAIPNEGGHGTRSPAAALELLFDLKTLDEAMVQRGLTAPEAVHRAIDRLAEAVRFFTLADGALPEFQGGVARSPAYVAAARAQDEIAERPMPTTLGGYHRLDGGEMELVVDAAPPAAGAWSETACAQPLGVEILVRGHRLIGPAFGRGVESGCTVAVGDKGYGQVVNGALALSIGPRLIGCEGGVRVERHQQDGALWLELAHEGWLRRHGILHQRRLFLNAASSELRGEDRLTPTARAQGPDGRHFVPYTLRFHLAPDVSALVSQDKRSVLLRLEGTGPGWLFRNDAMEVELEGSVHPSRRPSQQIVLRGHRRADSGARVRWKLGPAATSR